MPRFTAITPKIELVQADDFSELPKELIMCGDERGLHAGDVWILEGFVKPIWMPDFKGDGVMRQIADLPNARVGVLVSDKDWERAMRMKDSLPKEGCCG